MEKLRDKKIKWTETYTDKTQYLKDQFDDIIGKDSYTRWEGHEIGGSGHWYVIVSPADVHEHKRAKFFAGVRKLPDSYPAGGKYFDTIKEAYEYAFDIWGVPQKKSVPHFVSGDLKGISKKIKEWEDKRHETAEQEAKEEIPSKSAFSIFRIRTAMGKAAEFKSTLDFDLDIFIPIIKESIDDRQIAVTSPTAFDSFYEELIRRSRFATVQGVLDELHRRSGDTNYVDSAKTLTTTDKKYLQNKVDSVRSSGSAWNEENVPLAITTGDSVIDQAAMICTIGRNKRKDVIKQLFGENIHSDIGSRIDARFYRSNFEESILSAYLNRITNQVNLDTGYDFSRIMWQKYNSPQNQEKDDSIKNFSDFLHKMMIDPSFKVRWSFDKKNYPLKYSVSYGRRDSNSSMWIAAPYSSSKSYSNRITITSHDLEDVDGVSALSQIFSKAYNTPVQGVMDEHGEVIAAIKNYLTNGSIQKIKILGSQLTPKQYSLVLSYISKNILANVPLRIKQEIIYGLKNSFVGWNNSVKGEQSVDRDINQSVMTKLYGAYYGGKKSVTDKVTPESVVGIFEAHSGALYAREKANSDALRISILNNFDNLEDNPSVSRFLNELGEKNGDISAGEFIDLAKRNGLKSMFPRNVVINLFGEAVHNSSNISVKDLSPELTYRISYMAKKLALEDKHNGVDPANGSSSAILNFKDNGGVSSIISKMKPDQNGMVPFIRFSRVLSSELIPTPNGSIKLFGHDDVEEISNKIRARESSGRFDKYRDLIQLGDVKPSVYVNSDGAAVGKIALTDYYYWKQFKNDFKNKFKIIDTDPGLYEDILISYFVPAELQQQVKELTKSGIKIYSKSQNQEVFRDADNHELVFIDGKISSIVPKKRPRAGTQNYTLETPKNIDDLYLVDQRDHEQEIAQIGGILHRYFNPDNESLAIERRLNYRLSTNNGNVFNSGIGHRAYQTSEDDIKRLTNFESIQYKVLGELFKKIPSNDHLLEELGIDKSNISEIQREFLDSLSSLYSPTSTSYIRDPIKRTDECLKLINTYAKKNNLNLPYGITNYSSAYGTAMMGSTQADKIESGLGHEIQIKPNGVDVLKVKKNVDVSLNPSNYAMINSMTFGELLKSMDSLANGPVGVFGITSEMLRDNPEMLAVSSADLAVAYRTNFSMKNIQREHAAGLEDSRVKEDISSFVNRMEATAIPGFEEMSEIKRLTRNKILNAASERKKSGNIYKYDPFIYDGINSVVWFEAVENPSSKEKSLIIMTNTILSWTHGVLPDGEKYTEEIERGIFGEGPSIISAINSSSGIKTLSEANQASVGEAAKEDVATSVAVEMVTDEPGTVPETNEPEEVVDSSVISTEKLENETGSKDVAQSPESENESDQTPADGAIIDQGLSDVDSSPNVVNQEQIPAKQDAGVPQDSSENLSIDDSLADLSGIDDLNDTITAPIPEAKPVVNNAPKTPKKKDQTEEDDDLNLDISGLPDDLDKLSRNMVSLMRVAKVLHENGKIAQSNKLNDFIRCKISSNENKKVILASLSKLMLSSKKLLSEGKIVEAKEINNVINKYLKDI